MRIIILVTVLWQHGSISRCRQNVLIVSTVKFCIKQSGSLADSMSYCYCSYFWQYFCCPQHSQFIYLFLLVLVGLNLLLMCNQ